MPGGRPLPALTLNVAGELEWVLARGAIINFHYLHTFPDPRCNVMIHSIRLGGEWIGCLVWGRPQSSRCYTGLLSYGSVEDKRTGKVRFDRWEVINLARVWLTPRVQSGGELCTPTYVPGFTDRRGTWRSALGSAIVAAGIAAVRRDYLLMYPPCFLDEPYQLRVVLSYCDTSIHRGTLYRASGFALAWKNKAGIETWFRDGLEPLSADEDAEVRAASRTSSRSRSKRGARWPARVQGQFILRP